MSGNLRAEIARRRITYEQLAAMSDIPIHTLRRRMNDRTHSFTVDELQALSTALDIPAQTLLWGGYL